VLFTLLYDMAGASFEMVRIFQPLRPSIGRSFPYASLNSEENLARWKKPETPPEPYWLFSCVVSHRHDTHLNRSSCNHPTCFATDAFNCPICLHNTVTPRAGFSAYHIVVPPWPVSTVPHYLSQFLAAKMFSTADYNCPLCSSNLREQTALTMSPPFLYFSVSDNNVTYDAAINLPVGNSAHRYAIRGVIYLAKQHFTARLVKPNGALWYHDGILTGSTCKQDGLLHLLAPTFWIHVTWTVILRKLLEFCMPDWLDGFYPATQQKMTIEQLHAFQTGVLCQVNLNLSTVALILWLLLFQLSL
jgi:hypothetical protein